MSRKRNLRAIIDLLLMMGFAVILFTGIGLYMSPSGKVARETGWMWFGMDKEMLEDVHTYFGFSMVLIGAVHIALNYRVMYFLLRNTLNTRAGLVKIGITMTALLAGGVVYVFG